MKPKLFKHSIKKQHHQYLSVNFLEAELNSVDKVEITNISEDLTNITPEKYEEWHEEEYCSSDIYDTKDLSVYLFYKPISKITVIGNI